MEPRKIIQITAIPGTQFVPSKLYALCSDGTVWVTLNNGIIEWNQVDPVPGNPDAYVSVNKY